MRILAAFVAMGILTLASCSDTGTPVTSSAPAEPSMTAEGATTQVATTRTVTLEVPSMHCPFACWPKVKKTLESEQGVGTVTLAEQKVEGAIDNPVVHVAVGNGFDEQQAIAALAKAGFDDAEVKN